MKSCLASSFASLAADIVRHESKGEESALEPRTDRHTSEIFIFDDNVLIEVRVACYGEGLGLGEGSGRVYASSSGDRTHEFLGSIKFILRLTDRFNNTLRHVWTKPSLTCQCQMGDNYNSRVSSFLNVRHQSAIRIWHITTSI